MEGHSRVPILSPLSFSVITSFIGKSSIPKKREFQRTKDRLVFDLRLRPYNEEPITVIGVVGVSESDGLDESRCDEFYGA